MRFILVCIFAASSPALAVDSPELICTLPAEDGVHQSSDGVVDLKWSGQPGLSYQLEQQNDDGDFELRYEGPDQGSVRTGLAEGNHVFRVRSIDAEEQASEWADIRVQVEYMDAARVRLLLITGGIVVLATITAILFGHLNQRKEESA